jgi:hypothetical protein
MKKETKEEKVKKHTNALIRKEIKKEIDKKHYQESKTLFDGLGALHAKEGY